jgi:hypothetical protein
MLDRATNLRDTADFEVPSPLIEATSPSGRRTERRNRRVETLISIWFIAPSGPASPRAGRRQGWEVPVPAGHQAFEPVRCRPDRHERPSGSGPFPSGDPAGPHGAGGARRTSRWLLPPGDPGMLRSPPTDRSSQSCSEPPGIHSLTLLGHRTERYHRSRFAHNLRHGRCSSPWIQHPEPTGSGEQRPTQICNIKRDIPLSGALLEQIDFFDVARQIANGMKHFEREPTAPNRDRAQTEFVNPWSLEFSLKFKPSLMIKILRTDSSGDQDIIIRAFLALIEFWFSCRIVA